MKHKITLIIFVILNILCLVFDGYCFYWGLQDIVTYIATASNLTAVVACSFVLICEIYGY